MSEKSWRESEIRVEEIPNVSTLAFVVIEGSETPEPMPETWRRVRAAVAALRTPRAPEPTEEPPTIH